MFALKPLSTVHWPCEVVGKCLNPATKVKILLFHRVICRKMHLAFFVHSLNSLHHSLPANKQMETSVLLKDICDSVPILLQLTCSVLLKMPLCSHQKQQLCVRIKAVHVSLQVFTSMDITLILSVTEDKITLFFSYRRQKTSGIPSWIIVSFFHLFLLVFILVVRWPFVTNSTSVQKLVCNSLHLTQECLPTCTLY